MILVLSPSKTLDFESTKTLPEVTQPELLMQSQLLIAELRGKSQEQVAKLMHISDKLAALNVKRFREFSAPFTEDNARPALLAFKGDVYTGMEVAKYTAADFAFAQQHVRILSGLYGLLRPLDLMQPYRLEMGTKLKNSRGADLYAFWGEQITRILHHALAKEKNKYLINLASQEYFKAVKPALLDAPVITITFKESQKGKLTTVGLFAKKARGLMADYIIRKHIDDPAALKKFVHSGYAFEKSISSKKEMVFVR
jgi:cytoplasmic iron level regulating protein YaaA (DUF328/UPF0246 family)